MLSSAPSVAATPIFKFRVLRVSYVALASFTTCPTEVEAGTVCVDTRIEVFDGRVVMSSDGTTSGFSTFAAVSQTTYTYDTDGNWVFLGSTDAVGEAPSLTFERGSLSAASVAETTLTNVVTCDADFNCVDAGDPITLSATWTATSRSMPQTRPNQPEHGVCFQIFHLDATRSRDATASATVDGASAGVFVAGSLDVFRHAAIDVVFCDDGI